MSRLAVTPALVAGLALGLPAAASAAWVLEDGEQTAGATQAAVDLKDPSSEIDELRRRIEELERKQRHPVDPADVAVQLQRDTPAEEQPPRDSPAEKKPAEKPKTPEPAAAARTLITRGGASLAVAGFMTWRITNIGSANGNRAPTMIDFQATRVRPKLIFTLDRHWSAELDINGTSRSTSSASFTARDMFVQYQNYGYQARLGQAKIPYGYEVYLEGDTERVELERARIFAQLFPDERDLGAFIRTVPQTKNATWVAAGVYNGNGINRMDNNDAKNVAATLKVPIGDHHVVGFSGTYGTFRPGNNVGAINRTRIRELYGAEYRFTSGRFAVKSEIAAGKDQGDPIWGGYGGGRYYTGVLGGMFFRYDVFDPDRDAADNMWRRAAFGWYKDFTPNVRMTAEYDYVTNPATGSNDTYALQVQVKL